MKSVCHGYLSFVWTSPIYSSLYIQYNMVNFILFRARQSLVDVHQAITSAKLSSPQITFTGLSHFNNKVLYIDPIKDEHFDQLTRIAGWMKLIFLENKS